jgi:hypothetical protein
MSNPAPVRPSPKPRMWTLSTPLSDRSRTVNSCRASQPGGAAALYCSEGPSAQGRQIIQITRHGHLSPPGQGGFAYPWSCIVCYGKQHPDSTRTNSPVRCRLRHSVACNNHLLQPASGIAAAVTWVSASHSAQNSLGWGLLVVRECDFQLQFGQNQWVVGRAVSGFVVDAVEVTGVTE